MTAPQQLVEPTGLSPGSHVCWTFADARDFSAAVAAFLDEGRRRGEQLLLVGSAAPAAMLEALGALSVREELLASGQLQVRLLSEMYRLPAGAAEQVGLIRAEADAAVARGRSGLRIAADVTALAATPVERRQLHGCEALVDAMYADAVAAGVAVTGMCLYAASLGDGVLGPLAVLHPYQHHGDRAPLVHLRGRGSRLSLLGEVDADVAGDVLPALLDVVPLSGEVVLDLAGLTFLDVAGARMLTTAARSLAKRGVCLRMVGARRLPARCLELFATAGRA